MIYKQNLHTHTTYVDGRDTAEELILEAIARGHGAIGFSEHTYLTYSTYPDQLTPDKMVCYKNEIEGLKRRYRNQLQIFCGLEVDYYSDVDVTGFDYLIGSAHYLACGSGIFTFDRDLASTEAYINAHFGGNAIAFAKKYFETVALLPQKYPIDIIGHFDLIAKNNLAGKFFDIASREYLTLGYEAIHALRGRVPFFEVNTGAMVKGTMLHPYPMLDFLKELRACGFGAVITSDCHDKRYLDGGFAEAAEALRAAGFASKYILTENGFQEACL